MSSQVTTPVNKILYKKGDLFKALTGKKNIVVPQVNNVYGAQGAGFAAIVKKLYPNTDTQYVSFCKDFNTSDPKLYEPLVCYTKESFGYFANMICQTNLGGSGRNAKYTDLMRCMEDVRECCHGYNVEIYSPKFGCGLCGLEWPFVEALIEDIWIDVGLKVTIFEL